jgi:transcriptional regulator with XRE-family HTH domain
MDAAEEALAVARVRSWLRSGRAKTIRKRARLTQADVARAVGTDHPQISRWESGLYSPARGTALRLARLYEQLEEIIREEEAAMAAREVTA